MNCLTVSAGERASSVAVVDSLKLMSFYFAYGSNLESVRMRQRCPTACVVGNAVLHDHDLEFPLYDAGWRGAVAGVAPAEGRRVEGVVYEIGPAELLTLDQVEDVHLGDYNRVEKTVELADGKKLSAWIYMAMKSDSDATLPSAEYQEALVRGAREHGLSGGYIRHLESLETQNNT